MDQSLQFDAELLRTYDKSGPRYTSYPTAVQFHEGFGEKEYRAVVEETNQEQPLRPLSLYFHIPFCDTLCFYCACNKIATKNRQHAIPYLERLHKEIAMQATLFDGSREVAQLHWGGGTPTFISHDQMRALMDTTRQHFKLLDDDRGEYSIEIDPREVQVDTVKLLRELGFNRMSMGVQDFDPDVQKAVNRIQSEEITFAVMDAARAEGFKSVSVDLIYGLPFQTAERFVKTLDTIIGASPDRVSVFNYAHLPELFKPQRRIETSDLPSAQEKLDILALTIERLTSAGYVYIGMDHFAKPDDELAIAQREGSLYRNFQGYSTHAECDLIGMGVTSIGMVGNTYSQSERDIESYYAALDNDHLPLFRGFVLDHDDILRRDIITGLICNFKVSMGDLEKKYDLNFSDYFSVELNELKAMQHDGLLTVDGSSITVLPRGRLLIRNICMVFDRYLRDSSNQRFSKVI